MALKFSSSVLFVKDIRVSRRFYEEMLGLKILVDFGSCIGFDCGLSIWEAERAFPLVFNEPYKESGEIGKRNLELCFEDDEIQPVWQKISSAAVRMAHPLTEQPWGQLVFRFYDPDGHVIEIGEPVPVFVKRFLDRGMSVEEVSKRTSVPVEAVKAIAGNL